MSLPGHRPFPGAPSTGAANGTSGRSRKPLLLSVGGVLLAAVKSASVDQKPAHRQSAAERAGSGHSGSEKGPPRLPPSGLEVAIHSSSSAEE